MQAFVQSLYDQKGIKDDPVASSGESQCNLSAAAK